MSQDIAGTTDVDVVVRGDVPDDAGERAREQIAAICRRTDARIVSARVRLARSDDPAAERPVIAQGNLDVDGHPIRAQVAAESAATAIDLLQARLRQRMARLARLSEARRGAAGRLPYAWRGDRDGDQRPSFRPRPAGERQVIRRKSYELPAATPDEAAFDLDLMDFDFLLFTDRDTGRESLVYRGGPTGYRLARVVPEPTRSWCVARPLTVDERPAPVLSLADAVARLDATDQRFLFFADPATGLGRVLYRRYDGHYGLIAPPTRRTAGTTGDRGPVEPGASVGGHAPARREQTSVTIPASRGAAPTADLVRDALTERVVTVRPDAGYEEIVDVLAEHRVSAVPVVDDDGHVLGVVSEADLLAKVELPADATQRRLFERRRRRVARPKAAGETARELMTSPAITIEPTASVLDAARLMEAALIKRLPVVDRDGVLVGIVSRRDLLRVFLRPADAIRDDPADTGRLPEAQIPRSRDGQS